MEEMGKTSIWGRGNGVVLSEGSQAWPILFLSVQ
jgi:hypothetical protein